MHRDASETEISRDQPRSIVAPFADHIFQLLHQLAAHTSAPAVLVVSESVRSILNFGCKADVRILTELCAQLEFSLSLGLESLWHPTRSWYDLIHTIWLHGSPSASALNQTTVFRPRCWWNSKISHHWSKYCPQCWHGFVFASLLSCYDIKILKVNNIKYTSDTKCTCTYRVYIYIYWDIIMHNWKCTPGNIFTPQGGGGSFQR